MNFIYMSHQDTTAMLDNQDIYPAALTRFLSQTAKLLRIQHHNKHLKYSELYELITHGYITDNEEWPRLNEILDCYTIQNSTLICNKTIPLPHKFNTANLYFRCGKRLRKRLDSGDNFDSADITELIDLFSHKLDVGTVPLGKLKLLTNTAYFDADELSPHFDTTYFFLYHDSVGYILDTVDRTIYLIDPSFSFDHKSTIQTMIYMCYSKSGLKTPSSLFINEFKIVNVTSVFGKHHTENKIIAYFYSFLTNIDSAVALFSKETTYSYADIGNAPPTMVAYLSDSESYNEVFTPIHLNLRELKEAVKFYLMNNLVE